ncbi:MAG: type II toxin-antitoxin system RelE/ParE family toxin [Verrucomicrobiaceae bacterium]|nr:MAG: type II toxin-antitoxin system RelE/ParE family toxin [Verrucomicrobiaceae bacterium]
MGDIGTHAENRRHPTHDGSVGPGRFCRLANSGEWTGGWPVGKPLVDSLGGGLWEVRSSLGERIARTFFIVVDEEIILLHGIIKKSRTAPKQELDLARKRQASYMKEHRK